MRINDIPAVQAQIEIKTNEEPIKGAKQGELIKATVTSVNDGRVSLSLDNGQQLNAGKLASETLLPGDECVLELSSMSGGGANLKLVQVNGQDLGANIAELPYSLMRMDIMPDSLKVEFAKLLRDLCLTLSPDTLNRMGEVLKAFPDIEPEQAALFAASRLQINEQNVNDFIEFSKKPAQVKEFFQNLESVMKDNPQLLDKLLSVPAEKSAQTAQVNPTDNQAQSVLAEFESGLIPQGLSDKAANLIKQSPEWQSLIKDAPNLSDSQAREGILNFLGSISNELDNADKQVLLQSFNHARESGETAMQAQKGEQNPQSAALQERAEQTVTGETAEQAVQTAGKANTGGDASVAREQKPEQIPFKQVVESLFALIEEGENGSSIKEATASLNQRVARLCEGINEYANQGSKAAAFKTGNAIVSELKMGGEMHNLMYAQIPFETKNKFKSCADLYILKRERSRSSIDENNATIALCLETQNLGRLESLVRFERYDISIQFRVENEQVSKYVSGELDKLNELSFPERFRLRQTNVTLIKDAITPINAAKTMAGEFKINNTGMLDLSV